MAGGAPELSAEDKQAVLELYQKNPLLWADFRKIIDFVELLHQDTRDYHLLLEGLEGLEIFKKKDPEAERKRKERLKFATAVGFAEKCAELYLQIRTKLELNYLSEFPSPCPNAETACLRILHTVFIAGSCQSQRFRAQLVRTGVLQMMLNDVRHMQHLAADVLVSDS